MPYTVSHQGEGFTSFFSFFPEMAIGMNNYLYTFKDGQIYKHGFGNEFYANPTKPRVITYFNDDPTTIKLFKTLAIDGKYNEGDVSFADLYSELSNKRYLGKTNSFERKEGVDYSNIISSEYAPQYDSSVNGVGQLFSIPATNKYVISSNTEAYTPSIGTDYLFYIDSVDLNEVGLITAYNNNGSFHEYYVSSTLFTPSLGAYMLIKRNIKAESYGLRGTSLMTDVKIAEGSDFEIFSISTDVFKSFP